MPICKKCKEVYNLTHVCPPQWDVWLWACASDSDLVDHVVSAHRPEEAAEATLELCQADISDEDLSGDHRAWVRKHGTDDAPEEYVVNVEVEVKYTAVNTARYVALGKKYEEIMAEPKRAEATSFQMEDDS